ncbi:DNA-binding protein SMUBP-2 [Geranomyces variabilis]|nr:DNA-binding protein SMUBP-2 [Geranomyces variabilis]
MTPPDSSQLLHPHLAHLTSLLALERSHALSTSLDALTHLAPHTLQARGFSLLALRLTATRTGLGGKLLAEFQRDDAAPFPAQHSFRVGDVVGVVVGKKRAADNADGVDSAEGVVTRVEDARLTVAFKEDFEDAWEGKILRIDKLANDTPYVRMSAALAAVQKQIAANSLSPILRVLLDGRTPTFRDRIELQLYNEALNESQREAVSFALCANECALIHGPPGTGKTETVVELIRQFVKLGQRVLVCGPSNISVDNIVERLSSTHSNIPLVRIGHPARVLPSVLSSTLDYVLKNSDAAAIVLDMRAEIDANLRKLAKTKSRNERKQLWQANKDLRKDLRSRERAATDGIIAGARVVLCTLAGAGSRTVLNAPGGGGEFDVVVVDEASQALEAETYVALLRAPIAVFAGDHRQLPPTVRSRDASDKGFGTTVFDRLAKWCPFAMRMLDTQYRMNEAIMGWASGAMYEGLLKGHESVCARLLCDLQGVSETDETRVPVMWIDTAGCDMWEAAPPDADQGDNNSRSRTNPAEAELVAKHVETLLAAGVAPASIAVVTPYAAQVGLVRAELAARLVASAASTVNPREIEVGTVDGFQGREKDAIVISLVRSNDASQGSAEVGFLRDERRMNVAVTRARRHVCVVGDSETMERAGGVLRGLVEWFFEHGEVVSAHGL